MLYAYRGLSQDEGKRLEESRQNRNEGITLFPRGEHTTTTPTEAICGRESPYVHLTLSAAVALFYAMDAGRRAG